MSKGLVFIRLDYVRSILMGNRKLGVFNNWYILKFIKASKWRYSDSIDLSSSKVSIRSMPDSQHRMMFYVDGRPCSFRAMGFKGRHLKK